MTIKLVRNDRGTSDRVIREDAVKHGDRWIVPTRYGRNDGTDTKWVDTIEGFRAAGGEVCFNEDQTEIELLLPEGYKFSIQMFRAAPADQVAQFKSREQALEHALRGLLASRSADAQTAARIALASTPEQFAKKADAE